MHPDNWRGSCRKIIAQISQSRGGGSDAYKETNTECFALLEERAGVSLKTRLANRKKRMAEEGVCKTKRDKISNVDIIAEGKKLIEIYIAIVKEMAVK